MAGATAHLASSPRGPGGISLSARSDERGRIEWPRVPHGSYEISLRPPEGYVAESPPDLRIEVGGEAVERKAVLRRPPGRTVEGRVLGADGEGLPGAVVHVSVARGVETRTGAGGRFRFEHLPFGEHAVSLKVRGVAGIPSRTVRVGREPEPWLFHVPDGVEVSGRLLVPPGSEPRTEPTGEQREIHRFFELHDATVHWDSVPAGRGTLRLKTAYFGPAERTVRVPGPPVEVELPPRGRIAVRAPLLTGTGVEAATVTFTSIGRSPEVARTRSPHGVPGLGARAFAILPPGPYEVRLDVGDGPPRVEIVEVRDQETTQVVFD